MIRNICCCLVAAFALVACNDSDEEKLRFPETNDFIEEGSLTGTNMHFLGSATSTDAAGNRYVDEEAHFETAGLERLVLYMHRTRFSAAMPAMEMRMYDLDYTGSGKSIAYTAERVVPQLNVKDLGWQPMEAYALENVEIRIEGVRCTVRFSCDVPRVGRYTVAYEGRLYIEE